MPGVAEHVRERLIPPEVLAGLGNLELIARAAVDGALSGLHRSPRFGFSQEFAEYRAYVPGDDLRFVDWNVFARTDRTVVKRFFGDTNTRLLVLLDASASMGVGVEGVPVSRGVDKLHYGRMIAAALLHLASRQHDAAGLLLFDQGVRAFHPPSPRSLAIRRLYHVLDEVAPGGTTDWAAALGHAGSRIEGRSLVVLISDCWVAPAEFSRALKRLGVRGHDLLVLHVLTPEEKAVPAAGALRLRDSETGREIDVARDDLERGYPARVAAHVDELRRSVLSAGGHYLQMDTDQPLDATLLRYLRFRARHP